MPYPWTANTECNYKSMVNFNYLFHERVGLVESGYLRLRRTAHPRGNRVLLNQLGYLRWDCGPVAPGHPRLFRPFSDPRRAVVLGPALGFPWRAVARLVRRVRHGIWRLSVDGSFELPTELSDRHGSVRGLLGRLRGFAGRARLAAGILTRPSVLPRFAGIVHHFREFLLVRHRRLIPPRPSLQIAASCLQIRGHAVCESCNICIGIALTSTSFQ